MSNAQKTDNLPLPWVEIQDAAGNCLFKIRTADIVALDYAKSAIHLRGCGVLSTTLDVVIALANYFSEFEESDDVYEKV